MFYIRTISDSPFLLFDMFYISKNLEWYSVLRIVSLFTSSSQIIFIILYSSCCNMETVRKAFWMFIFWGHYPLVISSKLPVNPSNPIRDGSMFKTFYRIHEGTWRNAKINKNNFSLYTVQYIIIFNIKFLILLTNNE